MRHRPSPSYQQVGTPPLPVWRLQYGNTFRGCSYSLMFGPPGLLTSPVAPAAMHVAALGSRGFYIRAYRGLLPPRAADMLAVRIEQLTAEGLSPSKIRGLAGRS